MTNLQIVNVKKQEFTVPLVAQTYLPMQAAEFPLSFCAWHNWLPQLVVSWKVFPFATAFDKIDHFKHGLLQQFTHMNTLSFC